MENSPSEWTFLSLSLLTVPQRLGLCAALIKQRSLAQHKDVCWSYGDLALWVVWVKAELEWEKRGHVYLDEDTVSTPGYGKQNQEQSQHTNKRGQNHKITVTTSFSEREFSKIISLEKLITDIAERLAPKKFHQCEAALLL